MSKLIPFSALALALLAGCQGPAPIQSRPQTVAAQSANHPFTEGRETVGTARELFAKARAKAMDWSPAARLSHVEGMFISANGRNDFPMDASWTFRFVKPDNPFLAYQVSFRSEYTAPIANEIPRGPLKAQTPIDEAAWLIDSPAVLQTLAMVAPTGGLFTSRVELLSVDRQPVWQVPVMNASLRINARDGKPLSP